MDNYIKTIINGLKAWVENCVTVLEEKLTGAVEKQMNSKIGAVEKLLNMPVVELLGITDIGGYSASTAIDIPVDTEALFIVFHAEGGETVVGTRIDDPEGRYYLGFSSRGRAVRIDVFDNMVITAGLYMRTNPNFPLTVGEIWDSVTQKPGDSTAYALSANQGFELQKQITALTARVEALEQETTEATT